MFGRRYNEGLHQAIEAKEGVKVEHESKTLATITFQNLLPSVRQAVRHDRYRADRGGGIPPHLSAGRYRDPDQQAGQPVRTIRMRFTRTNAARSWRPLPSIEQCHAKGQPILVGTVSIEKSEELSKILKAQGHQAHRPERKVSRARGRDRCTGRQAGRSYHCDQHGRPWYRYHARRQR